MQNLNYFMTKFTQCENNLVFRAAKAIAGLSHRAEQHITVNLINIMCACFKMGEE